ncbi:hypothetical protein [Streptomyces sp. NPDC056405]
MTATARRGQKSFAEADVGSLGMFVGTLGEVFVRQARRTRQ